MTAVDKFINENGMAVVSAVNGPAVNTGGNNSANIPHYEKPQTKIVKKKKKIMRPLTNL